MQGRATGRDLCDGTKGCCSVMASFEIGPMQADEFDKCAEIACDAFLKNNPAVVHLGIPDDVFMQYLLADINRDQILKEGLSIVARDTDTDEVLAFLFLRTLNLRHRPPKRVMELHHGFKVMQRLALRAYDEACSSPPPLGMLIAPLASGRTMHCAMGGTSPGANGKGIGKALRKHAVDLAREHNFRTLVVESAHGASRHIWTKHCGAVVKGEVALDTFVAKDGSRPLQGVQGTMAVCEVLLRRSRWDSCALWPYFLFKLILVAG